MQFSPEEIASKEFSASSDEGYDRDEVRAFLSVLAAELERTVLAAELQRTVTSSDVDVPADISNEASAEIRAALEWAEKHLRAGHEKAEEILASARGRSDDVVRRSHKAAARAKQAARKRADGITSEADKKAEALKDQTRNRAEGSKAPKSRPDRSATIARLLDEIGTSGILTRHLREDLAELGEKRHEHPRILIVSVDDRALAPMAAALLREAVAKEVAQVNIMSAGIGGTPGEPADEQVRAFLSARGIDISDHRTRRLDAGEVLRADLVITMTQAEREQIIERVPEANAVLLTEIPELALTGPDGSPEQNLHALGLRASSSGRLHDLGGPVGEWPRLYHQCLRSMEPAIDALSSVLAGRSLAEEEADFEHVGSDAGPTFFDWLGHYAALICLFVIIGFMGGLFYVVLSAKQYEASTLVIDNGREFTARQLALISQATFQSPAVIGPIMQELEIDVPVQDFLESSVDLRPVPDTNTLMIVGRSDSLGRAQAISAAAADSFVSASNSRTDLTNFVVFGRSQGVSLQRVATSVALALGAGIGFWLGIVAAVVQYRWKRPILAFYRALMMSRADKVTIVNSRWWWLGALTPMPPPATSRFEKLKGAQPDGGVVPAGQPIAWFGEGNGTRIVVAHPGTRERELKLAGSLPRDDGADGSPQRVQLVWLR